MSIPRIFTDFPEMPNCNAFPENLPIFSEKAKFSGHENEKTNDHVIHIPNCTWSRSTAGKPADEVIALTSEVPSARIQYGVDLLPS